LADGKGFEPSVLCSNTDRVFQYWDDILGFIATIKLKETTASDLFRRLNSYSKRHGLYQALTAMEKCHAAVSKSVELGQKP